MIDAEPDNKKVNLFNRINWVGIFLFSICNILIVSNDLENKKMDPNKVPDKIIGLNILLFYCFIIIGLSIFFIILLFPFSKNTFLSRILFYQKYSFI